MAGLRLMFPSLAFCLIAYVSCAQAQVVALGASNVAGYGVYPSQAFPSVLEGMLRSRGRNYTVHNAGVGGETSDQIAARLDAAVPPGTRYVVLAISRNDLRHGGSMQQIRANYDEINRRLAARRVRVVNAMPSIIAAIRAGMTQADGIHLTPQGHQYVAQQILPSIR